MEDILSPDPGSRAVSSLFLGTYDEADIFSLLERYGVMKALQIKGINPNELEMRMDVRDHFIHKIYFHLGSSHPPLPFPPKTLNSLSMQQITPIPKQIHQHSEKSREEHRQTSSLSKSDSKQEIPQSSSYYLMQFVTNTSDESSTEVSSKSKRSEGKNASTPWSWTNSFFSVFSSFWKKKKPEPEPAHQSRSAMEVYFADSEGDSAKKNQSTAHPSSYASIPSLGLMVDASDTIVSSLSSLLSVFSPSSSSSDSSSTATSPSTVPVQSSSVPASTSSNRASNPPISSYSSSSSSVQISSAPLTSPSSIPTPSIYTGLCAMCAVRANTNHFISDFASVQHSWGANVPSSTGANLSLGNTYYQRTLSLLERILGEAPLNVLTIEYLVMQNPLKEFSRDSSGIFSSTRAPLPGQRRPGLGCGRQVLQMVTEVSSSKGRDFIANKPEFFHNAVFYGGFHFLVPEIESAFRFLFYQLIPTIQLKGLSAVSFAIHLGCCFEEFLIPQSVVDEEEAKGTVFEVLGPADDWEVDETSSFGSLKSFLNGLVRSLSGSVSSNTPKKTINEKQTKGIQKVADSNSKGKKKTQKQKAESKKEAKGKSSRKKGEKKKRSQSNKNDEEKHAKQSSSQSRVSFFRSHKKQKSKDNSAHSSNDAADGAKEAENISSFHPFFTPDSDPVPTPENPLVAVRVTVRWTKEDLLFASSERTKRLFNNDEWLGAEKLHTEKRFKARKSRIVIDWDLLRLKDPNKQSTAQQQTKQKEARSASSSGERMTEAALPSQHSTLKEAANDNPLDAIASDSKENLDSGNEMQYEKHEKETLNDDEKEEELEEEEEEEEEDDEDEDEDEDVDPTPSPGINISTLDILTATLSQSQKLKQQQLLEKRSSEKNTSAQKCAEWADNSADETTSASPSPSSTSSPRFTLSPYSSVANNTSNSHRKTHQT
eukprot:MONOS_4260.1-p1 / transcript=MONOS_4260.1 / gene=MONOS_4260 / organism=Monocercomonoides_exilis_PA203 / gene_product=unspecified product / transcript_product=unspecified product / location=Mono_scaffold00111:30404-33372(-) / protein_length=937 / sequence_SO=supercontig / SO=protein_coding / is_pseudo=false